MRIVTEIDLPVSQDEAWSFLEQIERHGDWMDDLVSIEFLTEQTRGAGVRARGKVKTGPLRVSDSIEVTEWEPPRALAIRHAGKVKGWGLFELIPLGNETCFRWTEELHFPWFLGWRVGELFGRPILKGIFRKDAENFRELFES